MIKERLIEQYNSLAKTIVRSLISDDPTKRKLVPSVDNRSSKKHKLNAEVDIDKEAKGAKEAEAKEAKEKKEAEAAEARRKAEEEKQAKAERKAKEEAEA
eukprot:scaffold31358_cov30-Cyclotella_meneghiniana.AAC.1